MTGSAFAHKQQSIRRLPATWVPTVYFAEGISFYGVEKGVIAVTLNGEPAEGGLKPQPEGSVNEVLVVLG
jgi:hypothetical protein